MIGLVQPSDYEALLDAAGAHRLVRPERPLRRTGFALRRQVSSSGSIHREIGAVYEDGPTAARALRPAEIADPHYRGFCYDGPRFTERLSFVWMRGGHRYVLSFYRQAGRLPALISALADLAELALPILRKHAQIRQMQDLPALSKLLARLALNFPKLALQERNVRSRTLVGMMAEAIALELGIGTSTVPTYRRRAYERYGISSASQLMSSLLD